MQSGTSLLILLAEYEAEIVPGKLSGIAYYVKTYGKLNHAT
jgi:hypothetical protein